MSRVAWLSKGYSNLDTDYIMELLTSPRISISRFLAARESCPFHWEHRVLTTEPPGKSPKEEVLYRVAGQGRAKGSTRTCLGLGMF